MLITSDGELEWQYLVEPSRMIRIIVNAGDETRHDSQLRIITTNVDIEMWHVVWGTPPPVLGVIRCVIHVADDGRLAVLRSSRPIEVKAVQPDARAIELLAGVDLVLGPSGIWEVKVQVYGNPKMKKLKNVDSPTHRDLPDS